MLQEFGRRSTSPGTGSTENKSSAASRASTRSPADSPGHYEKPQVTVTIVNSSPTGNAYVSWVGITGYFGSTGPDTFDGVYGPTMQEIRAFTSRPFLIAETSVQTGPDAVTAAQNLVSGVRQRPDVLEFVWFNYDKDPGG